MNKQTFEGALMNEPRANVILALRFLLLGSIEVFVTAAMLWHNYSFSAKIRDGLLSQGHALDVTFRATLLVICAALIAWQVTGASRRPASWKTALCSGLLTAVFLCVYAFCAITFDGYKWPFLGATNLELFRETDRLIFIVEIIPGASFLAGILPLIPIQRRE